MSGYASRLWRFATERALARTDLLGGALGVLVPAIFLLTGRRVPDDATSLIAMGVSVLIASVAILRLIAAPHFIWKEDQAAIADLKVQLDEPRRKGRAALMEAFNEDRANLIRRLLAASGDLRELNQGRMNSEATLRELYPLASPLFISRDFKYYWFIFEKNMKGIAAVQNYQRSEEELSIEEQIKCLNRYTFHHIMIDASVEGMLELLAFEDNHREAFDAIAKTAQTNCPDVDFTFARPSRVNFEEVPDCI